jgi:hypothetical protein
VSYLGAAALLREVEEAAASGTRMQQRFRCAAIDLIRSEGLLEPACGWNFVALDEPPGPTLHAGGEAIYAPRLLPESGQLTALACGVATVGARLEARVRSLFAERRASLALGLDEAGNRLLFALSRRLQDRMLAAASARGLRMAGELRPGDPGLALQAQAAVLRLADAGSIGVCLTGGHALKPLKSVSMVLGVGIALPAAHWSRCDDCRSRRSCRVAAAAAPAQLASF